MKISTNEPLKKMMKVDTVDEAKTPIKDHIDKYTSSLEKKNQSLTECIHEDSGKSKSNLDSLPENDIRFIDSKANATESKSSSIEFEELENCNVSENTSNIAAVMQNYSVIGEETVPSFMDYDAGMEDDSSDADSDNDDLNYENYELPSTSSGPSLELFTKEACKVMLQVDSSDDDEYNDIDKKILKFQEEKNGLENNTLAAVNVKGTGSDSAQYDDNSSETSETANTTIGGLIDIYNENQSSCPTFLDYNIMEDFMTQSSDDND